jgi:hypothetical protein
MSPPLTTDERFCYGANCTWFGPISEVGTKGPHRLPCCPRCSGMLFEMPHEREWWAGADKYEADGHPGYRAMLEWQRDQKKCFRRMVDLTAAYQTALKDAT